ncbi:hypothetical protein ACL6C3_11705 [Capilliphycus salinus ALCB114379]|uniref:hypothetical protein n=1 Tax=Capilliphycus salinus TaxID=2768948 RepID=UPI0039A6AE41
MTLPFSYDSFLVWPDSAGRVGSVLGVPELNLALTVECLEVSRASAVILYSCESGLTILADHFPKYNQMFLSFTSY